MNLGNGQYRVVLPRHPAEDPSRSISRMVVQSLKPPRLNTTNTAVVASFRPDPPAPTERSHGRTHIIAGGLLQILVAFSAALSGVRKQTADSRDRNAKVLGVIHRIHSRIARMRKTREIVAFDLTQTLNANMRLTGDFFDGQTALLPNSRKLSTKRPRSISDRCGGAFSHRRTLGKWLTKPSSSLPGSKD